MVAPITIKHYNVIGGFAWTIFFHILKKKKLLNITVICFDILVFWF